MARTPTTCLGYFERVSRLMAEACLMEGKIDLSARRQVTNKLRDAYGRASKPDKARIFDEVQAATGVACSMARRLLSGPRLSDLAEQVDRRQLRRRGYGDAARELPQMGVRLSSAAANSLGVTCAVRRSCACECGRSRWPIRLTPTMPRTMRATPRS